MSVYESLKEEAWKANLEIPRQGLALYTWGNVSAWDNGRAVFAIKPSGVPYDELKAADMVVMDLEGTVVEGNLNPSSDEPTHRVLYREFASRGIRGIVHTHSTHATAWAQACRPIPLLGTTHADHMRTPVPCTPYLDADAVARDYERETGELIAQAFRNGIPGQCGSLDPAEIPMVLVGGHGPFTWGTSAMKAVYHAAVLEEMARIALLTESLNPLVKSLPDYIIEKHYLRKHGPGSYYGQKKKD